MLASFQVGYAQKRTFMGYVKDRATGEILIGAVIQAGRYGASTITNKSGYFSLQSASEMVLTVSYVGYQKQQILVDTLKNTLITVKLIEQDNTLEEVAVVASQVPVNNPQPGILTIPVAQLKQVPMPLGETDVVKALALTPGVTVGNEATAGLLVRGGSPDQNLIRLDEATLYNQTHLFGFASSFNSDAVKNVTLYKGAFPARFGGRLSSVLDVTTRDGNQYRSKREINIGLLSSRFLIEGPLNRTWQRPVTYMLSARSSYITLFLLPSIIRYNQGKAEAYLNYWLYDLNGKLTVTLDSSRKLSVSLFRGQDNYYGWNGNQQERSKFGLNWGNTTGTMRYDQTIRQNLFWSSALSYSHYRYQTGYQNFTVEDGVQQFTSENGISSSVRDWTLRSGFEWFASPRFELRTGVESIIHRYQPSSVRRNVVTDQSPASNPPIQALEQAVYLENEWKPVRPLALNAGVRTVLFVVDGKTYLSLEPRFSGTLQLPGSIVLNTSYSQMRQFIHLIASNVIGFPNDVWVPATSAVPPQSARQVSLGLSRSLANGQWRLSIEGYQKWLRNLIDVPTGTDLLAEFNQLWQENIERNGIGYVRGLEFFLHKPTGRLNGWLSYTLSENKRRFATINEGAWFRANFDRRHVLAAAVNYVANQRLSLSAVWQYQSGQPATVPVSLFYDPESAYYPNYVYRNRNNYQAPAFHRLDVSASFKKIKADQHSRVWTIGLMNVYNRQNPLFINLERRGIYVPEGPRVSRLIGYQTRLSQQSFLPVLPYVSFARSF
ncbi:TonB-dependent siderophore receptor [Spirosoma sp. 209]|uniref:TonB-dependent receptor plug domain-containing protein n=1 Tax=Spirosoma sp. 209 TaxID=1955701 RepID=UPI001F24E527|nr:carboxypeptidase-like regulatory domain-containing protein [Spirosoma sp. 209]